MDLKVREERVFFVEYKDLNAFINHHYPNLQGKFHVVEAEELSNDSEKGFNVDGQVDSYDEEQLKKGKTMCMTHALLDDACRRGLIRKGTYVIEVCW